MSCKKSDSPQSGQIVLHRAYQIALVKFTRQDVCFRRLRLEPSDSFDVFLKILDNVGFRGEVAEWLMAADCKSALLRVRWFESSPLHQSFEVNEYSKCS